MDQIRISLDRWIHWSYRRCWIHTRAWSHSGVCSTIVVRHDVRCPMVSHYNIKLREEHLVFNLWIVSLCRECECNNNLQFDNMITGIYGIYINDI